VREVKIYDVPQARHAFRYEHQIPIDPAEPLSKIDSLSKSEILCAKNNALRMLPTSKTPTTPDQDALNQHHTRPLLIQRPWEWQDHNGRCSENGWASVLSTYLSRLIRSGGEKTR
jgi:hypothetical protein